VFTGALTGAAARRDCPDIGGGAVSYPSLQPAMTREGSTLLVSSRPRASGPPVAFRWFADWKANAANSSLGRVRSVVAVAVENEANASASKEFTRVGQASPRESRSSSLSDEEASGSDSARSVILGGKTRRQLVVVTSCAALVACMLGVAAVTGFQHPTQQNLLLESSDHDSATEVTAPKSSSSKDSPLQAVSTMAPAELHLRNLTASKRRKQEALQHDI